MLLDLTSSGLSIADEFGAFQAVFLSGFQSHSRKGQLCKKLGSKPNRAWSVGRIKANTTKLVGLSPMASDGLNVCVLLSGLPW